MTNRAAGDHNSALRERSAAHRSHVDRADAEIDHRPILLRLALALRVLDLIEVITSHRQAGGQRTGQIGSEASDASV